MRREVMNMSDEVVDGVCVAYRDDDDTLAEILVYLSQTTRDNCLIMKACDQIKEMDRCEHCGAKLETMTFREWHPEVDPPCYESVSEDYCPNCDI